MMSSTGLKTRTETQIQWPKIFPEQVTKTVNSSLVFIKQLTLVAVSTITYVKNALPETSYSVDNKLAGRDIRLLKSQCDDDLGNFLYGALMNAFEALEKKFLKQLVLCFYEEECAAENLIEYHMFEYDYSDDGVAFSMSSKARDGKTTLKCDMMDVKKRTVMMVRTCLVMVATFQQLPEQFDVSIRAYYNDNAPEDYQAPGFSPASHLEDPREAASFEGVKIGAVESPFHRMALCSYTKDVVKASREALASQNAPAMTPSQIMEDEQLERTSVSTNNTCESESTTNLNCICALVDLDWPMLTCYYCSSRQHAACSGVLPRDMARVVRHCCVSCAAEMPSRSTDTRLVGTLPNKRVSLAIFRCALSLCSTSAAVSVQDLVTRFSLQGGSGGKLMKVLMNVGVVSAKPDLDMSTRLCIDQSAVQKQMKVYFQTFDANIVERLVEETIAEQAIPPDPIAEVLGPLEQVSLKNASNIGRVVKPQDINNNTDDPTLNKYKEAFQSVDNNDMGLALSGSHNPVKDLHTVGKKRKNDGGEKTPSKKTKRMGKMKFQKKTT